MALLQAGISALVLFILYRFLIVQVGVEKLGLWSVLLAFVSATRVSELGLGGGVTRFVARDKRCASVKSDSLRPPKIQSGQGHKGTFFLAVDAFYGTCTDSAPCSSVESVVAS
ncbi:MAG: hypothetical protein OES46_20580 [Gammaproteobacteria bacterium]|nr:hypothetical protein [Gammaproteobacteria bacterium]